MKVKFLPEGKEVEIKPNQTVLQLAQDNDIHIQSVCKGIPSCSECRINITEGEQNVLPPSSVELNLIGTAYFVDQRRLSCQLRCFGDITVDLQEQVEKGQGLASSKRPRGYGPKKEAGESQAVMGNIMQESRADVNERTANLGLQEEEMRRELARIKAQKSGGKDRGGGRGDRDDSARSERSERPQRRNRQQNRDSESRPPNQKKSYPKPEALSESQASDENSENKPKKKNNRNRNRNRNRKPKPKSDG